MEKKTILTGIRPTGNLHVGHYFGSVENWVKLQNDYNTIILIADVQALTDNFDNPKKVSKYVKELTIDLLSCGIDPKKSTIVIQSAIPQIAELTIYYSNLVTVSRLYRNPTVKTEASQKKAVFGEKGESMTYGFLGYPVSQAADITVFKGDLVPAGEDQNPLIEQCREIVRKFNSIYGSVLKEPEILLSKTPRVKGLDGTKMGKSLGNAIFLTDSEEEVSSKIMKAITDPNKIKKDDPASPEVCMVYYYHKIIKSSNLDNICSECKSGTRGCVSCKKELINEFNEFLKPIREKRKYYVQHLDEVDNILKEGTKKASDIAEKTMQEVKEKMKINYFEK